MHIDPAMPSFVLSIFVILLLCILLRKFKQPYVVGYLVAGVILGPQCLQIITNQAVVSRLGAIGVIFLLFFAGMEMSPKQLSENWFVSLIGTIIQTITSVVLVSLLGWFFHWSMNRIILLGFVISLSSTAVVLKLLEDWREIHTRAGQNVIGIMLVQDILIIPMLIVMNLLGGHKPSLNVITIQIITGIILIVLTVYLALKDEIKLTWLKHFRTDHEMQLFTALAICFGMASLTSFASLSSPLGAYIAGMVISSARETQWVYTSISSLRTIFIAMFFISIGMLVDLAFIEAHITQLLLLVALTLGSKTLINASILKLLREDSKVSIYGGALLSQIGEFAFVLSTLGFNLGIVSEAGYKLLLSLITLTLVFSPLWIACVKFFADIQSRHLVKA